MEPGYYSDIQTWYLDNDIKNVPLRVWFLADLCEEHVMYYITSMIELPGGDMMLGMQEADQHDITKKSDAIFYCRMSDVAWCYDPSDMES